MAECSRYLYEDEVRLWVWVGYGYFKGEGGWGLSPCKYRDDANSEREGDSLSCQEQVM